MFTCHVELLIVMSIFLCQKMFFVDVANNFLLYDAVCSYDMAEGIFFCAVVISGSFSILNLVPGALCSFEMTL